MTAEPEPNSAGSFSLGCAMIFLVSLSFPVLANLGGSYAIGPAVVGFATGFPSFLAANALALIAVNSRSPVSARRGRMSLILVWSVMLIPLVLAAVVMLFKALSYRYYARW